VYGCGSRADGRGFRIYGMWLMVNGFGSMVYG
jgi:hypothetical protein